MVWRSPPSATLPLSSGVEIIAMWWTPDRQQFALDYLITNAGLTLVGAAGLVSRWMNVESPGGPASVNPISGAFGIAQWLGSRLPPIRGNTNFESQLAYAAQELNGSESRAGDVLRSALDAHTAAVGASMYERAEGYNPAAGTDNWTNRTAAGVASILSTATPPTSFSNPTLDTAPPSYSSPNFDGNSFTYTETGSGLTDRGIVIAVALLGVVLFVALIGD